MESPPKDSTSIPDALKAPVQRDDREASLAWMKGELPALPADRPAFGEIAVFSTSEEGQLIALRDLVASYAKQTSYARPLCLAVFGPPGSGKSFSVKQIIAEAQRSIAGGSSPALGKLETFNLTQIADADALASALTEAAKRAAGESKPLPVVFFDEFDAPRAGASYGWLGWFLAPMHDGIFVDAGKTVELKRAIYVFAGGTASTMEEFAGRRSLADFRAAKGPDFVSRLRGFLNVQGPNTEPRALRRAVILRRALQDRGAELGTQIKPDGELLDVLLRSHYIHGARSIGAVLEMSSIPLNGSFGFSQLPPDDLLKQHATGGALDPSVLGGYVALSGYAHDAEATAGLKEAWRQITTKLWEEGATLAYGGEWGKELTDALGEDSKQVPRALRRKDTEPRFRLWSFKSAQQPKGQERVIELVEPPEPTTEEKAFLREDPQDLYRRWLVDAIRRFRKRLQVSEISVARFAVAGKIVGYNGRFSGIAEEVMLTLALGKPVYVAGGFGGAARDVGALLGLERPWSGEELKTFKRVLNEQQLALLARWTDKLCPPPWRRLPVTMDGLVDFLKQHAIEGEQWPDNGLSPEENRELFRSKDGKQIAELVTTGLVKCLTAGRAEKAVGIQK